MYKELTTLISLSDLQPLTILLAFIGKAGAAAAFGIVYIFTAELTPTVIRNAAMGACSCTARIGSMLAPYIAKSVSVVSCLLSVYCNTVRLLFECWVTLFFSSLSVFPP